ncbi:MAG: outer membrane beta-barrel protein [Pseudomonadota bacterium]
MKNTALGRIIICLILLAPAGLIWRAPVARGESGLAVSPYTQFEETYTDNFFRSKKNKTKAVVSRISPGLKVNIEEDDARLDLDYKASLFLHSDPGGNEDKFKYWKQDYVGHNLNFYTVGAMGEHFNLGLEDQYYFTRDAASSDRFSLSLDRYKYGVNRVSPFATWDLAESGTVKLAYRNEVIEYLTGPDGNNSQEHRGLMTLTYHFNDQNHLDCENQYWRRKYDGTSSEYTSYQIMGLFRHNLNEYFTLHIGGGYHWRNYLRSDLKNWSGAAARAGLTGETDLTKVYINFEHNINDYGQGNSYYVSSQATGFVERVFFDAFPVRVGGFYQFSDFRQSKRKDTLWEVSGGLGYLFLHDRVKLMAQGSHTERASNSEGRDYVENKASLSLSIDFGQAEK